MKGKRNKEEYKERYKMKYVFSYWYEYGGCCLWSKNQAAYKKYGIGGIDNKKLPISEELKSELYKLEDEYQCSLNWDYPPDQSPWTEEQWNDFKEKATKTYYKLCKELGNEYEVIDNLSDCISKHTK